MSEPDATYWSDAMQISHGEDAFVLSFGQRVGDTNKPRVLFSVAVSPRHMQQILSVIRQSLEKYEKRFGEIEIKRKLIEVADPSKVPVS